MAFKIIIDVFIRIPVWVLRRRWLFLSRVFVKILNKFLWSEDDKFIKILVRVFFRSFAFLGEKFREILYQVFDIERKFIQWLKGFYDLSKRLTSFIGFFDEFLLIRVCLLDLSLPALLRAFIEIFIPHKYVLEMNFHQPNKNFTMNYFTANIKSIK